MIVTENEYDLRFGNFNGGMACVTFCELFDREKWDVIATFDEFNLKAQCSVAHRASRAIIEAAWRCDEEDGLLVTLLVRDGDGQRLRMRDMQTKYPVCLKNERELDPESAIFRLALLWTDNDLITLLINEGVV